MEAQAAAERQRRATVTKADGEKTGRYFRSRWSPGSLTP